MPSHFSDIGFTVANADEYSQLAGHAAEQGEVLNAPGGYYIRWSPGAGVELWAHANRKRELLGCNPHFAGNSSLRMGINQPPISNPENALDGSLYCWAGASDDEPESGVPMVVDLPDFDMVRRRISVPAVVTMQVAAFAHELSCFADDEQFHNSQNYGVKFAAEFYIPSGTFAPDMTYQEPPQAEAVFAGHVLSSDLLTNQFTGQQFYYLSVKTLPGTLDIVSDPAIVEGQPVVGGVVNGSFWLSGRIISDLPPASERNLLARLLGKS
jgi:hypothetical protein